MSLFNDDNRSNSIDDLFNHTEYDNNDGDFFSSLNQEDQSEVDPTLNQQLMQDLNHEDVLDPMEFQNQIEQYSFEQLQRNNEAGVQDRIYEHNDQFAFPPRNDTEEDGGKGEWGDEEELITHSYDEIPQNEQQSFIPSSIDELFNDDGNFLEDLTHDNHEGLNEVVNDEENTHEILNSDIGEVPQERHTTNEDESANNGSIFDNNDDFDFLEDKIMANTSDNLLNGHLVNQDIVQDDNVQEQPPHDDIEGDLLQNDTVQNTFTKHESTDELINKLADLDLDLDDDLLLDEDFLDEEEPLLEEPVSEEPISEEPVFEQPKRQTYAPTQQSTHTVTHSEQNNNDFIKSLEDSKKKNDAYDFPDELVVNKVKPAVRHQTNKYAPSKSIPSPAPVIASPRLNQPVPASKYAPSSTASNTTPPKNTKPTAKKPPSKSFFEDLPGDEIVQPKRAARTAAPAKAINKSPSMNPPQLNSSQPIPQPPKNKKPPVNPYQPKSGTSPIFQQHTPHTGQSGIAKPPIMSSSPLIQPVNPISAINAIPAPIAQQQLPPPPASAFPSIQKPIVNTKVPNVPSTTSPYVPNAGPYAPSSQKTHSRANSLVGIKGNNNPYAPALSPVISKDASTLNVTHSIPPPGRVRGFSNNTKNIYKTAPKIVNPEELTKRQFPIINWTVGANAVVVIPNKNFANHPVISTQPISQFLKDSNLYSNFPGPLIKNKTKKKDLVNWLEVSQKYLSQNERLDELLLNNILLELVNKDGERSDEFIKNVCLLLNPNLDYTPLEINNNGGTTTGYKLDNLGINTVFTLLQQGNIDSALEYSITKCDWALALILAGPEKFAKVASEYARSTFPFAKTNNNKVLHIMPVILKVLSGNMQGVIQDLTAVPNEGDYANVHWREIISSILSNYNSKNFKVINEFLIEFGKFLQSRNNLIGSEISFILSGSLFNQQLNFMTISSGHNSMYTQIYEFLNNGNYPHLLSIKLKHASTLADYGLINESQKYIDYINSSIKTLSSGNKSPFITSNVLSDFQKLIVRLSECGSNGDNTWFGKSKVNLDKIWGQIDKFIIGGEEPKLKQSNIVDNGVFSKFSPSVSRNASQLDLINNHYHQSPSLKNDVSKFDKMSSSPVNNKTVSGRSPYQYQPPMFNNSSQTNIDKPIITSTTTQPFNHANVSTSSLGSHKKQQSISSVLSNESDELKKTVPQTITESPELKPPFNNQAPILPSLKKKPSKTLNSYAPRHQPPTMVKKNKYEPRVITPTKETVTNIDDSFEMDQSKPLLLNFESNQLDGFPIPGSPEYTTRANSVLGTNAHLYSSRLSQSQQSALYQQYEVQDDTVRDYVPIAEEDDEDEEEKKVIVKQTKNEIPRKVEPQQKKDGWFKMFKKDDGKPKPIRAKLGEKVNPFYYDEKHKRWLDRSKPIEEQLKASQAPPPPPSMKKPTPVPPSQPPAISSTPIPPTSSSTATTDAPPPIAKPKPKPKSNLANAGLDDLLSLSESSSGPKRSKRAGRRNYVNVMDK